MPPPIVTRQQPVERVECVVVRPGPELDDREPRRRVRHEDRQEPVPAPGMFGDEPPAGAGQVGEPTLGPGPDGETDRLYGKMLRSASLLTTLLSAISKSPMR